MFDEIRFLNCTVLASECSFSCYQHCTLIMRVTYMLHGTAAVFRLTIGGIADAQVKRKIRVQSSTV